MPARGPSATVEPDGRRDDGRCRRSRGARQQSRSGDLPGDRAHTRAHQARHRRVLPGGRRRDHAGGRESADDARALAEGRSPGNRRLDTGERRRRRVLPEAGPTRGAGVRADGPDRLSRQVDTPTRSARPSWQWWPGRRRWGRSPSTPGRCARTTSTIPTSCGSTSTRRRAPTSTTRCGSRPRRAGCSDDLGYAGFPKTSGGPRRPHLRADRAALELHRCPPRRDRLRARARATAARAGDDEVVEGGARRADLRRLQPERARPDDRLRLQRAAEAGRAGLGAGDVGRAARDRPGGLHGRDHARPLRRGRRPPRGDRRRRPLAAAAARSLRARRGRGRGRHALPAVVSEDAGRAASGCSRRGSGAPTRATAAAWPRRAS